MEDKNELVELLLAKAKDYGQTTLHLAKLKTLDKTADVVSTWVPRALAMLLALIGLLFLSVGLAVYLGDLLGKPYYGYFIVAGFYGMATLIMHFFLFPWSKSKISNKIIAAMLQ